MMQWWSIHMNWKRLLGTGCFFPPRRESLWFNARGTWSFFQDSTSKTFFSSPIFSMDIIENENLLLTSSMDCTVRLWTLEGEYIGTFGQVSGKKIWERRGKTKHFVRTNRGKGNIVDGHSALHWCRCSQSMPIYQRSHSKLKIGISKDFIEIFVLQFFL